jgi:hypothetical protein
MRGGCFDTATIALITHCYGCFKRSFEIQTSVFGQTMTRRGRPGQNILAPAKPPACHILAVGDCHCAHRQVC